MPPKSVELVRSVSTSSTGHCSRLLPVLVSSSTVMKVYLEGSPTLGDVGALGVGLADPTPEDAAALGRIVEGLGGIELAPVVAEADADVGGGVQRRPRVPRRVVPPQRVVVMAIVVHARLHHVHHPLVPRVHRLRHVHPLAAGHRVEVDALPHPRGLDAVEEAREEVVGDEVGGAVDDGDAGVVLVLGADDDPPVAVGGVAPGGGGVAEVAVADGAGRVEDGVGVVLGPVGEEGVVGVGGDGEALDLDGGVGGAGVEHGEAAVGEGGGGAGPDAVDVVPLVGNHGEGEVAPVDEVAGHRVPPRDLVAPHRPIRVVLVEQVVPTLVVHRTCIAFPISSRAGNGIRCAAIAASRCSTGTPPHPPRRPSASPSPPPPTSSPTRRTPAPCSPSPSPPP
ncbi:Os02g0106201, partial [Oryza sativa Japonica Group]